MALNGYSTATFVKGAESLQVYMPGLPTMQRPAFQSGAAETRIFTVYQDDANTELAFRQQFGWQFVSSSARSYSKVTGIDAVSYGSQVSASTGTVSSTTHHKTDLVMKRVLDGRGRRLKELEAEFEQTQPGPVDGAGGAVGGAILFWVVGLFVVLAIGWVVGLVAGQGVKDVVVTLLGLGLTVAAVWIGVSLRKGKRALVARNAAYQDRRKQILAEVRRLQGLA